MSLMRFLVDEDSPQHLCQAVRATEPRIDILFIGEPGAPPKGTLDPDLLAWLENERRALISNDHNTMPGHAADHQAAGNHTYGVFLLRSGFSLQDYEADILLFWTASEAEDWRDFIGWLPL